MAAISYGFIYLFAEALHVVYHINFGLSEQLSSLTFLPFAVGVVLTFLPRFYDLHIVKQEIQVGRPVEPEKKLLGFYIAAPLLAIGLWIFSTTVPPLVPNLSIWISLVALIPVGYGIVEFDSVLCAYLTDIYMAHASSANAPVAFLRAVMSGVFPLFAPHMFEVWGANYGIFFLAGLATAFCGIAAVFWGFAKRARERSRFAGRMAEGKWK